MGSETRQEAIVQKKNVAVKMLIMFGKGYLILFADVAHWQELK